MVNKARERVYLFAASVLSTASNRSINFEQHHMSELRVEQFRGGSLESVHRIHAAVVDHKGTAIAYAGDPRYVSFMRSGAKPLQALPLIKDGVVEQFAITQPELALACASHNSEVEHVKLVASFLARLGYSEGDLACGPHKSLRPALDSHPQDA